MYLFVATKQYSIIFTLLNSFVLICTSFVLITHPQHKHTQFAYRMLKTIRSHGNNNTLTYTQSKHWVVLHIVVLFSEGDLILFFFCVSSCSSEMVKSKYGFWCSFDTPENGIFDSGHFAYKTVI